MNYYTIRRKMIAKKTESIVFLILFCLFSTVLRAEIPNSYVQAKRFTVTLKNVALKEVITYVEKNSEYVFFYKPSVVESTPKVNVNVKNATITQLLDQVLPQVNLKYDIKDRQIVLKEASIKEKEVQKKRVLQGIVKDESGIPIIGASIQLKGTGTGVISDMDGLFKLPIVGKGAVLVISYVGFVTQEIKVGDRSSITVKMEEDSKALGEVVVIGYGAIGKKDITGSIARVDMDDMSKAPVFAYDQALAGRVAGVQVAAQEDGQPGSAMNIIIRGQGSVTQSTAPLYVIDGIPAESDNNAILNPDDIESISVLKDASETAIYGARGANGVIVIETKRGKTGKPTISFKSSVGFENVSKTMDMMNPYDFVRYQLELEPTLSNNYLSDGRDLDYYQTVTGRDWQDHTFRTGLVNMHSIALRGGSEKTLYSISGSYTDNKAIVINTGYQRVQGRVNLDQYINKKIRTGIRLNFATQKDYGQQAGKTESSSSSSVNGNLLYSVWAYRPVTGSNDFDLSDELFDIEAYDPDDSGTFVVNPVINAKNVHRQKRVNTLDASGFLTYDIMENLQLKVTGGLNYQIARNEAFYNSKTLRGTSLRRNNTDGVNGSVSYAERLNWVNENTLTWKKLVKNKHYFNVMGGFSISEDNSWAYGTKAINLPNEELGIKGLSEGTPQNITSSSSSCTLASFMGRLNYRLSSKYYFTFTMRADGSSKFSDGNKWGYFPSGAIAWQMGREKFMQKLKFVSDAKFRLSYGVTGNNRVSRYAYRSSVKYDDYYYYPFNNEPGLGIAMGLGNKDLKWELVKQWNVGVDLSFLKERISLVADYYVKTTDDMLLNSNIPNSSGFSKAYMNIGSIENRGLELTLNTLNIKTRNFTWETNFNISFNRNKILALADGEESRFSNLNFYNSRISNSPMYIAKVGAPAALFYGLVWDGNYQYEDFDLVNGNYVLKSTVTTNGDARNKIQPGDIKYKDLNEDRIVDDNDKTVIGDPMPKHTGGFSNVFTYKGLSLNVFFQWKYGGDLMNANRYVFEGNPLKTKMINQYASYNNRWTPENQTNEMFRTGGEGPLAMSSRTIEDGSYLRLKTVAVSYTIPNKFTKKFGISGITLNASAQNLITWTKYSGMDPEVSINYSVLTPGFDFSAYPHSRRFVFGINLTL